MTREEFNQIEKLYHYTSLESLSQIMINFKFKFGELPKMNDITEATKEHYAEFEGLENNNETWIKLDEIRERLKLIGQISLTQDGAMSGYAINSMWGHYAVKGEGCCIVLDKQKIIKECLRNRYKVGKISYDSPVTEIIIPSEMSVETYLEEQSHEIFFHKSVDWKPEQEFRIINLNINPHEFNGFNIVDCIVAIILHTNCKCSVFDCPAKQKIIEQIDCNGIPILEYRCGSMWSQDNKEAMLIDKSGNDILHNYQYDINI